MSGVSSRTVNGSFFDSTVMVIAPGYDHLLEFLANLPSVFDSTGELINNARNELRTLIAPDHKKIVVKSFKKIYLPLRIAFSYFIASKAERSFVNALTLKHHGFETPDPVAFIESKKAGWLTGSYYVCLYSNWEILKSTDQSGSGELFKAFAEFTFRLHRKGILNLDYNNGNILYTARDGKYIFSLIDINRLTLGQVSYQEGLKNFSRLTLSDEDCVTIAKTYSQLAGEDQEKGVKKLLYYRTEQVRKRKLRRQLSKPFKPIAQFFRK